MSLLLKLVAMSQSIDFETGGVSHCLTLETPDGATLVTTVDEGTAQRILALFAGEKPVKKEEPTFIPAAELSGFERIVDGSDGEALVFGSPPRGEGASTLVQEVVLPTRKAQLVGKDNAGNPIIRFKDGVDPADVTGGFGVKDEDGVGQI